MPQIPRETVVGARATKAGFSLHEYQLVLMNTEFAGKSFRIGETLKIGKAPDNDVVIEHPTVSRNHLVIHKRGEQFLIQDLGSTNGTFIDEAEIKEGYLRPGSILEVGDVQLRLQSQLKSIEVVPVPEFRLGDLVGQSLPMRQLFSLLNRISPTDSTLLLIGETGSGKGAASKTIHSLSLRADGPFVVFDCAAVSENLIESELFGHEKGAFTGAIAQRVGCLERANGGTLFLDEIDDLPLDLQPKLLRALEDREFRRLGQSGNAHKFDCRVVAASKRDLWLETQEGRFREDLYFRLSVFTLSLPSLRERKEDIPLLVDAMGAGLWARLKDAQREQFMAHTWPGNVRELRNAVERLKHMADIPELATTSFLREYSGPAATNNAESLPVDFSLKFKEAKEELVRSFEREYLARLLAKAEGNVAKAARDAGVDRKHLYSLLAKYELVSPSEQS
jgi:DNA-binding NtrC family response regulator